MYYVTTKDIIKIKETVPHSVANVIDKLFAGEEINFEIDYNPHVRKIDTITRAFTRREDIKTKYKRPYNMVLAESKLKTYIRKYPIEDREQQYITFKIPKKTGGLREICAPLDEFKEDLRDVTKVLTSTLGMLYHNSAWAYVPGRDVVGAMQQHVNNKSRWYLKLDFKDFFGSCDKQFIVDQLLKQYPFCDTPVPQTANETARHIANLATLNDGLPQGTPLSPMLTNIIMAPIDYEICKTLRSIPGLKEQRYVYTRYADDIIISAKEKFDYNLIVDAIKNILRSTPLKLNDTKTRFGSNAGRNWNLGVMCNKDNKITIGYRNKQKLKPIIHNYIKDHNNQVLWDESDLQWLLGQLSWLSNVEPKYYTGYCEYLYNKYNINIKDAIISDIKKHTI